MAAAAFSSTRGDLFHGASPSAPVQFLQDPPRQAQMAMLATGRLNQEVGTAASNEEVEALKKRVQQLEAELQIRDAQCMACVQLLHVAVSNQQHSINETQQALERGRVFAKQVEGAHEVTARSMKAAATSIKLVREAYGQPPEVTRESQQPVGPTEADKAILRNGTYGIGAGLVISVAAAASAPVTLVVLGLGFFAGAAFPDCQPKN